MRSVVHVNCMLFNANGRRRFLATLFDHQAGKVDKKSWPFILLVISYKPLVSQHSFYGRTLFPNDVLSASKDKQGCIKLSSHIYSPSPGHSSHGKYKIKTFQVSFWNSGGPLMADHFSTDYSQIFTRLLHTSYNEKVMFVNSSIICSQILIGPWIKITK